jgi:hypothetical protein
MAVNGNSVATLMDVVQDMAPDGSQLVTAEVLKQQTEVLEDMTWMEGNMITGHKDSVRSFVPEPSFRRINEGVKATKSGSTQIEATCASLEDFSKCDRELAILSGDIGTYRAKEAKPHIQGFANKMARQLFYGSTADGAAGFNGLSMTYWSGREADTPVAANMIDAGGTGTNLRSIHLIGFSHETITGIFPKNTIGGLHHADVTTNTGLHGDGFPIGDVLSDGNGGEYMGFRDHWIWRCGLMVKDWRYGVRICNIDMDQLKIDQSVGANLLDLLIQATETIESTDGVRAAFYMDRTTRAMFRRQMVEKKSAFLSMEEVGGKVTATFDGIPLRRLDALNVAEQRVLFA